MTDIRTLWRHHQLDKRRGSGHSSSAHADTSAGDAGTPDDSWTKAKIVEWLGAHGVPEDHLPSHATKSELLGVVALAKAAS